MSDEREQVSTDGDVRSFETAVDTSTIDAPTVSVPYVPEPVANVDSPTVAEPGDTVSTSVPPTDTTPVDSNPVPSGAAGSDTPPVVEPDPPLWTDTVDSNAAAPEEVPAPTAPDPVPVNTVPEPVPVSTVPDSPVPVPETPPVAAVELPENVSGKLYTLDSNGIPDPTQELFAEDVSEFLLEYLASKDGQEFVLGKIRFILRKNYERDDDNK